MKHIKEFSEFTNESNMNERASFSELKDKYEDVSWVEFLDGKKGYPNRLVFKFEDKYDRDQFVDKLKSMGFSSKQITKNNADKYSGGLYKYEIDLIEI